MIDYLPEIQLVENCQICIQPFSIANKFNNKVLGVYFLWSDINWVVLFQYPFWGEFCRKQNKRNSIPGMGTATGKVEIFISIVPVMRSEISHLHNLMTNTSEYRSPGNIINRFPGLGRITHFKFDMLFQILKPLNLQSFQNPWTGSLFQSFPILLILLIQMSDRDNNRYRIFLWFDRILYEKL